MCTSVSTATTYLHSPATFRRLKAGGYDHVPEIDGCLKMDTNLCKIHSSKLKIAPFELRLRCESDVSPGSTWSTFQLGAVRSGIVVAVFTYFSHLRKGHNPAKIPGSHCTVLYCTFFFYGRPFALSCK